MYWLMFISRETAYLDKHYSRQIGLIRAQSMLDIFEIVDCLLKEKGKLIHHSELMTGRHF